MEVVHDPSELRARCDAARAAGERVGVVPTMGALHAGHMSLVDTARAHGGTHLCVTIFVNPLQFAPTDDLGRYPRPLAEDIEACRAAGVALVFTPQSGSMYPEGFSTHVEVEGITSSLEGEHRPGHFRGVTTVVAKLLNLAGPCVAAFGRKDYQQWRSLVRMVQDLDMPIEMVASKIVREPDGLALSSRNRYLTEPERARALGLVEGLRSAWDAFEAGERNAAELLRKASRPVRHGFDRVDYVALADADHLGPIEGPLPSRVLLAAAAHLGSTRLIDNVVLGEDPRPG